GAQMSWPCFSDQRGARIPFTPHAQPEHKAEKRQNRDRRSKSRSYGAKRISQNAQDQRFGASHSISNKAKQNSTDSGSQQSKGAQPSRHGLADAKCRHHVSNDQAVQHHVKSIQSPAQRGRNQCAFLRGCHFRHAEGGGGHWGAFYQRWGTPTTEHGGQERFDNQRFG